MPTLEMLVSTFAIIGVLVAIFKLLLKELRVIRLDVAALRREMKEYVTKEHCAIHREAMRLEFKNMFQKRKHKQ